MVKYGKLYREIQIKEFKGNYIDYKKLKKKIKEMQKLLPRTSQEIITKQRGSNMESIKMNLRPSLSEEDYSRNSSTATTYYDKYGAKFKEFKELLDQEFQRCYKFFKKIKKQIHNKINKHLYTQTNYSSYNIDDIIKEIGNLRITMYSAKCLNEFINDNMMAIKKILKKFDKKFYNYYGNFGPKYMLDNLCMQNSDLEYLLQFKIIDEASCIIESNVKLLRDYYLEIVNNNKNKNIDKNIFYQKYNEILQYIRDIDELIYFKIQYKEWFYFRRKDKLVSSQSNLYKNLMFNPILFSAYHKDDLMNKFLSRKGQIKEIEEMQTPLSLKNKINIILIYIQIFFYNTLVSGIYPLIFLFMEKQREIGFDIEYTFLIIPSTYFCSYFSIMFYYYFGKNRIKCAYIISYILFFISSVLYIFSFQDKSNFVISFTIGLLVTSRIILGLGANPTMGKNYILSNTSKYYLPLYSKIYVLISILGHSFGPFIEFILHFYNDKYKDEIFPYIYYSNYNSIGWFGAIFSLFLIIINILFFTSPTSKGFNKLKTKDKNSKKGNNSKETPFLNDDLEDSQDKEFYKLQREMKNKIILDEIIEEDDERDSVSINSTKIHSKLSTKKTNEDKSNNKDFDVDLPLLKTSTLDENNNIDININIFGSKNQVNPLLYNNNDNYQEENYVENDEKSGNFVNINMIPRTIDDLIRKEKKKFSYLNRNLLIILCLLFFDSLLKENFIAYCSYYINEIIERNESIESKDPKYIVFEEKWFCCLISGSYLLEIFSLFFIFPLYKINKIIKKLLLILMTATIILMVPLLIEINLLVYFIIISLVFLISSIIEVVSSCYLAYLIPPDHKFSHINAGALPLYVMIFGKLCGCLICLTSFVGINLFNNHVVIILTLIGYGISGFYLIKSKNFKIKAIARIMRKSELETNIY